MDRMQVAEGLDITFSPGKGSPIPGKQHLDNSSVLKIDVAEERKVREGIPHPRYSLFR